MKKSEIVEVLKDFDLSDQAVKTEWRNILIDLSNNIISADIVEDQFAKRFLQKYCLIEVCEFIHTSSKKFAKEVANPEFKNMMDCIKNDVRSEISSYDRYWSGKISAETIRTIQKDYIKTEMDRTLQSLLDKNQEKFLNIISHEFRK